MVKRKLPNSVQEVDSSKDNSRASTPISQFNFSPEVSQIIGIPEEYTDREQVKNYKFKDPKFEYNSVTHKLTNKKKVWKSLKQIITQERSLPWKDNFVHYSTINAPPSFRPAKKYSDISGLPAAYTDPHTKLHYATAEEFEIVRSLPGDIISGYLALRRANNPIP